MNDQILEKRLKFLTVIWGERYVEDFVRVSLPSFMAPGNLPALAKDRDLEILIMTTKASMPVFERQKAFRKLKKIAPVRFIAIDDLVTNGNYGVTLTYAYARGIMDSGEEQTNTTFVFMNADFVLSDGSLGQLREKIDAGHPCIMSASLRACSEAVFPVLLESVAPETGLLVMPSREMVGLAMTSLHPTVLGKTVTQGFVSCTTYNQLYWQVDEETLLGRYHLIFMLAISPEKPLTEINSYCDYGFVPEMVPSGKFHVIGDSDEFFMLELQPEAQEREFLYCGRTPMAEIASAMSLWTTREHRNFATADTVFHSGELPPELAAVRQHADDFVSRLQAMMRPDPVVHVDHYYWVSGVEAWKQIRAGLLLASTEAESMNVPGSVASHDTSTGLPLDEVSSLDHKPRKPPFEWSVAALSRLLLKQFFAALLFVRGTIGTRPFVSVTHHLWLDCNLALSWARNMSRKPNQRNLVIGDPNDPLPASVARRSGGEFCPIDAFLNEDAGKDEAGRFDNVFLHVFRKDTPSCGPFIKHALDKLVPGGELTLFIEHSDADTDSSNFTAELAQYAPGILPRDWIALDISARFVGGRTKRILRKAERRILSHVVPMRLRQLPTAVLAIGIWTVIAGLTTVNNVAQRFLQRWHPDRRPAYSSAAAIRFSTRRKRKSAASTPAAQVDNAKNDVDTLPEIRRAQG